LPFVERHCNEIPEKFIKGGEEGKKLKEQIEKTREINKARRSFAEHVVTLATTR